MALELKIEATSITPDGKLLYVRDISNWATEPHDSLNIFLYARRIYSSTEATELPTECSANITNGDWTIDVDEQARGQLQRLANVANGIYHDANSASDLDSALGDIDETIVSKAIAQAQSQSEPASASGAPATTKPTPTTETVLAPTTAASPTQLPTEAPSVQPTPTPIPLPTATTAPVIITSEGSAQVSSTYSGFPASLALDGSLGTSWFSAGSLADGNSSYYRWDGNHDDLFLASAATVKCRLSKDTGAQLMPSTLACDIDSDTWAVIDKLAFKTYAPVTEESRAGAGAGLNDND